MQVFTDKSSDFARLSCCYDKAKTYSIKPSQWCIGPRLTLKTFLSDVGKDCITKTYMFLKTFGDIISSKIVLLVFWHWPLGLGSTRLNAQWPSLRHSQRFDLLQYIITYHLIHGNIFWNFGIFKNFVGIFLESFQIKLLGIFPSKNFPKFQNFIPEPWFRLSAKYSPLKFNPSRFKDFCRIWWF